MNETMEEIDPRKLIVSNIIWDLMPHASSGASIQRLQDRLGLVPSDTEGLAVEHNLSDARKKKIADLVPVLSKLSAWTAEVIMEKNLCELEDAHGVHVEVPDEVRSAVWSQTATQIITTSAAILSHLMETGVIRLGDGLE
jgi:hypothetical protein